ncbi:hypothetical protein [Streptomyces sp. MZ04]|uniref:hypothetical protein n=1 Tax=Streptomyces sp. MZ04 TaxID=2559236 RepID=UPI00107EAB62|nr:hypothetical protein [Streptomyces sp. MZ04]TGA88711.1 hypothetical protein E2651_39855 [Streptomyces sp. MZ04]
MSGFVRPAGPRLAEELGREQLSALAAVEGRDSDAAGSAFLRAFFADFAPAQAEAVRRAMRLLAERGDAR